MPLKPFTFEKHNESSPLVLVLPDYSKEFTVETDASGFGIEVVLLQQGRPIAYMSKALSDKQLGMSFYDKEMLVVVIAILKWRPYLIGRHFFIKTDHQSLKYLMEQKVSTPS
ncbi:UNVERIFIED_CONTAM: Retrovirus-related Pol polyprotein from transposon.6 [Sesamum calycinum]|uniref:Retrovirus-related Pol polyprotein from transposon.6 n=1 Tax=Sesamum calycinum TaxID=2727403 RepID=A0AAW2P7H0_9LAMI